MTGLKKELQKNMKARKMDTVNGTAETYMGIANILGIAYTTARRKLDKNSFTVAEALTIYNLLYSEKHLDDEMEFFKYLFTEK